MIQLIPAIDLIDGKCVRLTKGDYTSKTVYSNSPADIARRLESLGYKRLHVVDLDGAKSKHVVNEQVLKSITDATNLEVDFGGGIKTDDDIRKAFDNGAAMVTIGSIAVTAPDIFTRWLNEYGTDRIILGADVKEGKVSINGWQEESSCTLLDLLQQYVPQGVSNVLCTDVSKDGMLEGTSIDLYKQVIARFPNLHLIASGGVSCINDILALEKAGIPAVVFGKAIYEGRIDLKELIDITTHN